MLPGWIETLQHGEDSLLERLLLAVEALHLEPHVLGFPCTHAAGKEPGLVLGQLGLEYLELTLGFVELQLERLQLAGSGLYLGRELLFPLVGSLVCIELGKRLPSGEETIDLKIQILHIEQIGKTRHLHWAGRVVPGPGQPSFPSLAGLDLRAPLGWEPPPDWRRLVAIDSHTGGEPFRVVFDGVPDIEGATMLERRRFAEDHFDELRRALMWEPRGHADMYGGFVGPPVEPSSDISVLFIHNEGFSTMCGHGIIALTKVVLDTGVLPADAPQTVIRIDTPAGQIEATAQYDGRVRSVAFRNVPSFVAAMDQIADVPGLGQVRYDLAFGGAFYAYVSAEDLELSIDPTGTSRLIDAGRAIKQAVIDSGPIEHPVEPGLGFLYGVIFFGPAESPAHHSRNVCIFADGEVDRSPTGTGVSGRLAIHHARGEVAFGEAIIVESILGSTFTGRVMETTEVGGLPAVIPEVTGTAHISGRIEMWMDPNDALGAGFLIR